MKYSITLDQLASLEPCSDEYVTILSTKFKTVKRFTVKHAFDVGISMSDVLWVLYNLHDVDINAKLDLWLSTIIDRIINRAAGVNDSAKKYALVTDARAARSASYAASTGYTSHVTSAAARSTDDARIARAAGSTARATDAYYVAFIAARSASYAASTGYVAFNTDPYTARIAEQEMQKQELIDIMSPTKRG